MPALIDRVGAYRGTITEGGVTTTKNGFPQYAARFHATQRYVDEKGEMEHFGLTEPGWVDWSEYDQEMVGYLVLFGEDKNNPGQHKPIFHFEALQRALGWDGASFASLATLDTSKSLVTFWVDENEYNGVTSLRVNGIDAGDAAPTRGLRALDSAGLKDLDARFAGSLVTKKAAPAKPASAAKPAAAKPAYTPPGKEATAKPAATAPATTAAPAAKKPGKPPAKPAPVAEPAQDAPFEGGEMTKDDAWDHVITNRGTATEDAVAEAWLSQCDAVAPGVDEAKITNAQWGAIAAAVLTSLTK